MTSLQPAVAEARALTRFVIAWFVASWVADFLTSVMMMSLSGPSFESNIAVRTAFMHPAPSTISAAILNQWKTFVLLILSAAVYSSLPITMAQKSKWRHLAADFSEVTLGFTFMFALLRWGWGAGSNMVQLASTFGVLAEVLAEVLVSAVMIIIALVFVRRLNRLFYCGSIERSHRHRSS